MKRQISIYYPIAFSMIGIGLLMLKNIFYLKPYQMNAINIGAALLTLSTVLIGSIVYKRWARILTILSNLFLIVGTSLVFLGFLLPGFKDDFFLKSELNVVDTNPLVLICLGITVASIVQFDNFINNSLKLKEREINKLKHDKSQLEKALKEANDFIEKGEKNE